MDNFLLKNEKKAFKPLSQATFAIAKFQYLFIEFLSSAIFFQSMSDGFYFSFKYVRWLYVPSERTYNHLTYFEEK